MDGRQAEALRHQPFAVGELNSMYVDHYREFDALTRDWIERKTVRIDTRIDPSR